MQRYHGTSVLSRNSAASTARSATQNGAIDHPQPGADKVDSALPVVRAGAVSLHRLGHLRSFPQRRLAFLTISLSIATGNPATFPLWLERRRAPLHSTHAASAHSSNWDGCWFDSDVALFYGLAIGTSAKCADGQGWRH